MSKSKKLETPKNTVIKNDWTEVNDSLLKQLKSLKKLSKRLKKDPRAPTPKENYRLAKSIQICTRVVQKLVEQTVNPSLEKPSRGKIKMRPLHH